MVDSLRETAARTQKPIVDYLAAEQESGNVDNYRSYYIVNLIQVKASKTVILELAKRRDVAQILPNTQIAVDLPAINSTACANNKTVEWNISHINAPAVWEKFSLDGTGVVVGIIDSGVDWQHDALQRKWRGYNAENPSKSNPTYSWFDAINGKTMPYDDGKHGTHVAGTILGSDSAEQHIIGVAPGAQWIAAKALNHDGVGVCGALLAAGQFMLAPGGNPAMAPDIINNSWSGGAGINEWYRVMVQNWRAAGILPVFAAGNNPGYSSVTDPANYPESFAVATIDNENQRASFSAEGPGPYNNMKPNISAPGVNIRSAVPGGSYEAGWSGTSMAAPHVAGIAALLMQLNSSFTPDHLEQIIMASATPLTDAVYPNSPNYGYGYGLVDAYRAVTFATKGFGEIKGTVTADVVDIIAPVIAHDQVNLAYRNRDLYIYADISDDYMVTKAETWVKQPDNQWAVITMDRIEGDLQKGRYKGTIPGNLIGKSLEYIIRATDCGGNEVQTQLHSVPEILSKTRPGRKWDFNQVPSGWVLEGSWEWGRPYAGKAGNLLSSNLNGKAGTDEGWLVTPPLDLSNVTEASLRLSHWYDTFSFEHLSVFVLNANTEELVSVACGQDRQWRQLYINLNNYVGSSEVYVVFQFESGSYTARTWLLDDVQLWGSDRIAPAAPENLQATVGAGITLTWNQAKADNDLAGYNIYRATAGNEYLLIATTEETNFTDTSATANQDYLYAVSAYDFSRNESTYSNPVAIKAQAIQVVYYSDFENDNGGFASNDIEKIWEWGTPAGIHNKVYSGKNVWATNLHGSYPPSSTFSLESPIFDLTGLESPVLHFAQWYDLEYFYDYAEVWIQEQSAADWILLNEYTGASGEWRTETISLDGYGNKIKIAFKLLSGG